VLRIGQSSRRVPRPLQQALVENHASTIDRQSAARLVSLDI
jgi:hypothetical protein